MHCCNHIYTLSNLSENTLFKQVFCTAMPHCLMHPSRMDSLPPTLQLVPIHVIICTFLQPTERERGMAVGACRSSVAQRWRSSQRPWVRSPATPPFFLSLCRFKGLRTVTTPIVFNWTITIGLRTVGESCPSDSHAVITLTIHYDQQLHTAIIQYTSHHLYVSIDV